MKQTQIIMGTPIIVDIIDREAEQHFFDQVFNYFRHVDDKFSTYKETSEITKINKGLIKDSDMSAEMREVFNLSEQTRKDTNGYFNIKTPAGIYDPSGLVKGWSIWNASKILKDAGVKNFYVEAGGDIEAIGHNDSGEPWCIGIQNPFSEHREVIKKIYLTDKGIATSGNYVRGNHIYNPHDTGDGLSDIVSITVIGPNVYEADRYATSAYAMGENGIHFIEELGGYEGYAVNKNKVATMTTGFNNYTK